MLLWPWDLVGHLWQSVFCQTAEIQKQIWKCLMFFIMSWAGQWQGSSCPLIMAKVVKYPITSTKQQQSNQALLDESGMVHTTTDTPRFFHTPLSPTVLFFKQQTLLSFGSHTKFVLIKGQLSWLSRKISSVSLCCMLRLLPAGALTRVRLLPGDVWKWYIFIVLLVHPCAEEHLPFF